MEDSGLHITALRVQNFRSYKEKQACDGISFVNVVIGPNNAGKSNLVRVLQWYRGMARGQTSATPNILHTGNQRSSVTFEIEYELDDQELDELTKHLKFQSDDIAKIFKDGKILKKIKHEMEFGPEGHLLNEVVWTRDVRGSATWVKLFGNGGSPPKNFAFWYVDFGSEVTKLGTAGQSIDDQQKPIVNRAQPNRAFDWQLSDGLIEPAIGNMIIQYINSWTWLMPYRAVAARSQAGQDTQLQPSGGNLVRVLNTLQTEDPDSFEDLVKKVQQIIPGLIRITAPPRGTEVTGQLREPGGVSVEMADTSSGFQQALVIVTRIITAVDNSLIMIEEPEMNLHASAQRALFSLIKSMAIQKNIQFLLTTHSTIFAEIGDDTSVYYVDKVDGSSRIRKLKEAPELRELKQALGHENTDLFGFNALLIVEGPTEARAFPKFASALDINLVRAGIKLMNIGGSGEVKKITHLLEFVKDSGTIPFLMLDGHSVVGSEIPKLVKGNLVKSENVLILPKEFEDCFDTPILAQALEKVASNHNVTIQVKANEISPTANEKSTSSVLHRLYHDKTGYALSKPELGEAIADIVIIVPLASRKLTKPEEFLKTVKSSLGIQY